ncbi:MAG: DUF1839 family protein [Gemmatimonadota bacterium]|nr:DUF1839 family protein [Gemmatimonadota bacterium]
MRTPTGSASLSPLHPASYTRHALHDDSRSWPQSNCYVDLWVEILHSLALDPIAGLAFTLAIDFEGDQWTFFKYPLGDLYSLYGVDVQELSIWRPVVEHVEQQVARGRLLIVEVDAWFLPDTAGTSHRAQHEKTSIAVRSIDRRLRTLGYFHNSGYYTLAGDDFDGIFASTPTLPPYVELVKLDAIVRRDYQSLAAEARTLASQYLGRRPAANPFIAYGEGVARDVDWLAGEGLETFHPYAFATLRQCGACLEMAATFLRWLGESKDNTERRELGRSASDFDAIATSVKALQFAFARAVRGKRATDFAPTLAEMAARWETSMRRLDATLRD